MCIRDNPSPTRAEVTDVANAIFDGTDAVMLSNETAVGKFPVETVEMMGRVIEATERSKMYWTTMEARDAASASDTSDCLLYTSDAADEEDSVDLGGRRIIKK